MKLWIAISMEVYLSWADSLLVFIWTSFSNKEDPPYYGYPSSDFSNFGQPPASPNLHPHRTFYALFL